MNLYRRISLLFVIISTMMVVVHAAVPHHHEGTVRSCCSSEPSNLVAGCCDGGMSCSLAFSVTILNGEHHLLVAIFDHQTVRLSVSELTISTNYCAWEIPSPGTVLLEGSPLRAPPIVA